MIYTRDMKIGILLGTLALCAATGCTVEDNLRLSVGHSVPLRSLPPVVADANAGLVGSADRRDIPGDAPSLPGLDRSHIAESEFRVPIDRTFHHPHYTRPLRVIASHPRQRGEFPTYNSALQPSDPTMLGLAYESVAIPAWSVIEFLWLAPAMVIDGPWETTSSPNTATDRANPNPKAIAPGVITLTQAELHDLQMRLPSQDTQQEDPQDTTEPTEPAKPDQAGGTQG